MHTIYAYNIPIYRQHYRKIHNEMMGTLQVSGRKANHEEVRMLRFILSAWVRPGEVHCQHI